MEELSYPTDTVRSHINLHLSESSVVPKASVLDWSSRFIFDSGDHHPSSYPATRRLLEAKVS